MRRMALTLGLVLLVALSDTVTKLILTTPDWGRHHVDPADPLWPLVACTAALLLPSGRWPLAVALGGAWSNALWTRTDAVPNPFVARLDDGFGLRDVYAWNDIGEATAVAYNAADVCIMLGTAGFVACWALYLVRVSGRVLRQRRPLVGLPSSGGES